MIPFIYTFMAIFLTLIFGSAYLRFNSSGRLMSKIPGPKGFIVIGNMFDIMVSTESLFIFIRKTFKTHNNIFKLVGVHLRCININNPDYIEKILSTTRFNEKRIPYNFLYPWLGQGLLVSGGKKWRERRKMLTKAFHFNILNKFLVTINEQTSQFLSNVQREVGKQHSDINPLINRTTLQVICETSMGTSMHEDIISVFDKYFNAIHVLGQSVLYRLSRIYLYEDLAFGLTNVAKIQKNAVKNVHAFTTQIIKERREFMNDKVIQFDEDDVYGKKNRMAMLDLLLEQEKIGNIDEEGIREEVDTFMFEGHDTTASALSFMVMRIANETEVQGKIYEELQRIFGKSLRSPTMEDLSEMKYLECCIKESLRIYPSVPFIGRVITEEVVLGDYTVPKSTECNIFVYDVHHREDIYPEPAKFIPERFLPDAVAKRHPYAYIPFSAGPRNCIGQKFAMLEMKSVMSGLLRRFQLLPVTKPDEMRFYCDIVLRASNPIYVCFLDRKGDGQTTLKL